MRQARGLALEQFQQNAGLEGTPQLQSRAGRPRSGSHARSWRHPRSEAVPPDRGHPAVARRAAPSPQEGACPPPNRGRDALGPGATPGPGVIRGPRPLPRTEGILPSHGAQRRPPKRAHAHRPIEGGTPSVREPRPVLASSPDRGRSPGPRASCPRTARSAVAPSGRMPTAQSRAGRPRSGSHARSWRHPRTEAAPPDRGHPALARRAAPFLHVRALALHCQPVQPGPRTTRPGRAPVCSPLASTGSPLTNTWTMPVAYWWGSAKVAWSWTWSGSNTTRSA